MIFFKKSWKKKRNGWQKLLKYIFEVSCLEYGSGNSCVSEAIAKRRSSPFGVSFFPCVAYLSKRKRMAVVRNEVDWNRYKFRIKTFVINFLSDFVTLHIISEKKGKKKERHEPHKHRPEGTFFVGGWLETDVTTVMGRRWIRKLLTLISSNWLVFDGCSKNSFHFTTQQNTNIESNRFQFDRDAGA